MKQAAAQFKLQEDTSKEWHPFGSQLGPKKAHEIPVGKEQRSMGVSTSSNARGGKGIVVPYILVILIYGAELHETPTALAVALVAECSRW